MLASVVSLVLFSQAVRGEEIRLVYSNGFDWEAIFDAGFRPRQLLGMETRRAYCQTDERIVFQFEEDDSGFLVRPGRTNFGLLRDEQVRYMRHLEDGFVTNAEGYRRMLAFQHLAGERLFENGNVLPAQPPPEGELWRVFDEGAVIAKVGGHSVYFECNVASDLKKVSCSFAIMATDIANLEERFRTDPIPAPSGYEEHDMSPAYDYEAKLAAAQEAARDRERDGQRAAADPDRLSEGRSGAGGESGGSSNRTFDWRWLVALVGLLAVGVFGWRWVTSED